APIITGFTEHGGVGSDIEIAGVNLGPASVERISLPPDVALLVLAQRAELIRARLPPGVHTGKLTLSGAGGVVTSATNFIVNPVILGASPSVAGPGQTITL